MRVFFVIKKTYFGEYVPQIQFSQCLCNTIVTLWLCQDKPEKGSTMRNRLVSLLTNPDQDVATMTAEFLFVICKHNVGRLVKHAGEHFCTSDTFFVHKNKTSHDELSSLSVGYNLFYFGQIVLSFLQKGPKVMVTDRASLSRR